MLWLPCRLAATALIGPLAWEHPYAVGSALKRQKKRNGETILNRKYDWKKGVFQREHRKNHREKKKHHVCRKLPTFQKPEVTKESGEVSRARSLRGLFLCRT